MKIINSHENKNFKLCQQLGTKKYRDKLGLYLIEGPNLLDEAVDNGADIRLVIFNEKMMPTLTVGRHGNYYRGAEVAGMSEKLFEKLAQTETSQGVVAIVRKKSSTQEETAAYIFSKDGNVVVLDRLQDLGNIGAIIRTADAAGYKGVLVLKGTGDIYAPKAIRAATGSVFRMPVLFLESPAQAIDLLKKNGKKIVSTCMDTENSYFDIDLSNNIGLVIGNEGNGICKELMEGSDIKVKIPMTGKIESLNAAVAAGIIMYEAIRK